MISEYLSLETDRGQTIGVERMELLFKSLKCFFSVFKAEFLNHP